MGNSDRVKFKLAWMLVGTLVFLCGCMHQYLMKLSNGDEIISLSKPKLQGTNYLFTGDGGTRYMIPESRVTKIRAVKVVNEEKRPATPSPPVNQQKPKRWYFLWLA
jgi:hypothetical protein